MPRATENRREATNTCSRFHRPFYSYRQFPLTQGGEASTAFRDQSARGAAQALKAATNPHGTPFSNKSPIGIYTPYDNMHQAVVEGVAYFSFQDGQFWRSDGTECGTFMVNLEPHHPTPFGAVGEILVFGSCDAQVGFELYGYDTSEAPVRPCSRTVATADASAFLVEETVLRAYPNPFKNDFSFTAPTGGGETTRLQVFTLYGELVEDIGDLKPNTEHRIGQSWPKGVYVTQVIRGEFVERYRVVKE